MIGTNNQQLCGCCMLRMTQLDFYLHEIIVRNNTKSSCWIQISPSLWSASGGQLQQCCSGSPLTRAFCIAMFSQEYYGISSAVADQPGLINNHAPFASNINKHRSVSESCWTTVVYNTVSVPVFVSTVRFTISCMQFRIAQSSLNAWVYIKKPRNTIPQLLAAVASWDGFVTLPIFLRSHPTTSCLLATLALPTAQLSVDKWLALSTASFERYACRFTNKVS